MNLNKSVNFENITVHLEPLQKYERCFQTNQLLKTKTENLVTKINYNELSLVNVRPQK